MLIRLLALALFSGWFAASAYARDRFVLAAEDDWPPYSYKQGKQAEGRSVDIVKAAFEAAGADLVLDVVPFNRGLLLTKSGQYAGVFNAGLNKDIERNYLIPRHHVAISEQVAVARTGQTYEGIQSINHRRLALTLGYTYPTEITGDTRNKIEYAASEIGNLKKIAAGRADYTVIDRLVASAIFAREPALKNQLAVVGKLHSEKIYVLFGKTESGSKALSTFERGMDKIQNSGELKGIIERWEAKFR